MTTETRHLTVEAPAGTPFIDTVREFTIAQHMQYLLESAVVLHANPNFDLDLTLLRGRVYLRNNKDKGPAKVCRTFCSI